MPHDIEGLQGVSATDLAMVEAEEPGLGMHFPKFDADLYLPALLEGVLGSAKWSAENALTETLGR